MTEFEKVLEECLRDLERGVSSVDQCLRRYPNHSLQLEPVLLTAAYLQYGREARPSSAFKTRVRTKLIQGMQAHPRKAWSFHFMFIRPAASLLVILLALLITGTAYAQGALPGGAFYAWKLASENAWRTISTDPVKTDLVLSERRIDELIAVRGQPALQAQALQGYLEVRARLKSEINLENQARILPVLESQLEELNEAGIPVPQVQPDLPFPLEESAPVPNVTRTPAAEVPQMNPSSAAPTARPTNPATVPELPEIIPTDLPDIIPTIQVPPDIVPTIQNPSDLVPTIDIPPLLP